jgi:hypothetical protein
MPDRSGKRACTSAFEGGDKLSLLRNPERRVSVIKYEQANETMAKTMTNAATECTLPVMATSAMQISGAMPPRIAAN